MLCPIFCPSWLKSVACIKINNLVFRHAHVFTALQVQKSKSITLIFKYQMTQDCLDIGS